MQENKGLKIKLEGLMWLATMVVVFAILYPIYQAFGDMYRFYLPNALFIIVFITYARYIFLLKHTLFARNNKIKFALVFLSIPLFFYFTDELYDFQNMLETEGLRDLIMDKGREYAISLEKYTKVQYILFGSGTMIVLALLPIRMIISIWRQKNRSTI